MPRPTPRPTRLALLLLPFATGCLHAFNVSSARAASDAKPEGLPFYLRSEVHRQHTVYEYPWVRVTLGVSPVLDGKMTDGSDKLGPKTVYVIDVPNDAAGWDAIRALQDRVRALSLVRSIDDVGAAIGALDAARDALPRLPRTHANAPDTSRLRLVANYVERVAVVDYSRTYYLNATIPPFGSNSLDAQLAADGTLSKSVGTATGGVGEAVASLAAAATGFFPIKEALTVKWVPTKKDSAAVQNAKMNLSAEHRALADPKTLAFRLDLAIDAQALRFDFTKDEKPPADPRNPAVLKPDYAGTFTVTPVERPAPATPAAENAISFTGKVQLPEPKKP